MPKTKRVLLLMDPDRGWTRDLLRGIAKYSRLNNPWGVYRLSQFYWRPEHKRNKNELKHLKEWKPDGIITREMDHIDEVLELGIPIIGSECAKEIPGLPIITSDFSETGRMAADYFLDKGFKNFAYCGYSDVAWSTMRLEGFRNTLSEKGYEVDSYMKPISNLRMLWISENEKIAEWIKKLPKNTGLMTCSDDRGLHILEACKVAGRRVPDDIAILGVDNDEILCDLANPPLSSIAFNTEDIGFKAARSLDKMMNGIKLKNLCITAKPAFVVSRHSTDIFAVEDEQLKRALSYIKTNRFKLIQVSDVVKATSVSRRNLELRFKKWLNRSILDEIKRVHVGLMSEMLIETNYSIAKIASLLGHSSVDNICRYFKNEKKLSPSEFRDKYREMK
jgi:LacI family transcriptional regulator